MIRFEFGLAISAQEYLHITTEAASTRSLRLVLTAKPFNSPLDY
jgi:hypothetical protein